MKTLSERTPQKFNLPVELTTRLAETVPAGKRSRFVEQAIEKALKAEAKAKLLGLLETQTRYPTNGENSTDVLSRLRQQRTEAVLARHNPQTR